MSNRTYYRGPDAVVTDRFFIWHTTPTKGFDIRDLQHVGLVQPPFVIFARRRWELRATYRGRQVTLYSSFDSRVFNQVARALRRAVEDARPAIGRYDLAVAG
jgi:hypothetical protein